MERKVQVLTLLLPLPSLGPQLQTGLELFSLNTINTIIWIGSTLSLDTLLLHFILRGASNSCLEPLGPFVGRCPKRPKGLILEPRDTMFLDLVGLGATRDVSVGRSVIEMNLGLPVHEGGAFPSNS